MGIRDRAHSYLSIDKLVNVSAFAFSGLTVASASGIVFDTYDTHIHFFTDAFNGVSTPVFALRGPIAEAEATVYPAAVRAPLYTWSHAWAVRCFMREGSGSHARDHAFAAYPACRAQFRGGVYTTRLQVNQITRVNWFTGSFSHIVTPLLELYVAVSRLGFPR